MAKNDSVVLSEAKDLVEKISPAINRHPILRRVAPQNDMLLFMWQKNDSVILSEAKDLARKNKSVY